VGGGGGMGLEDYDYNVRMKIISKLNKLKKLKLWYRK
jgi:hypothetical protein